MATISKKTHFYLTCLQKKQKFPLASQPLGRTSVGACDQGGCAKFLAIVTKCSYRRFGGIKEKMFLINFWGAASSPLIFMMFCLAYRLIRCIISSKRIFDN